MIRTLTLACSLAVALAACKKEEKSSTEPATPSASKSTEATKAQPVEKPEATVKKEAPAAPAGQSFDATGLYDLPIKTLDGKPSKIGDHKGKALLLVNVASKCGLTPQYETLESMHKKYAEQGFAVLGFPCNQFGGQEPGSHEEIAEFCSATYGVTFPMFEKVEVNGEGRHDIYKQLTETKDADGKAGDIQWNFEKFVVSADGKTIHRFRPKTVPDAPEVVAAIEAGLPPKAN